MKKILVTGASGFIGKNLMKELIKRKFQTVGVLRKNKINLKKYSKKNYIFVDQINSDTNWTNALSNIDLVIHCAGLSNDNDTNNTDSFSNYWTLNVDGTKNLVEQASKLGVKRIIYISTVKVHGERSDKFKAISHKNKVFTETNYSKSKYEAEKAIKKISSNTNLEYVIIRSPIVYGAGVGGNFLKLMTYIKKGIPLPLGSVQNVRSFISINNLIDFIVLCATKSSAVNETFLVSDNHHLSTVELIKKIASMMGKKINLLNVPIPFLKLLGFIFKKSNYIDRLTNSLQVDISHACKKLNWKPPFNTNGELKKMIDSFLNKSLR